MIAYAKLDDIALMRPDGEPLFSGLSLAVGAQRYGIVGRNGCGKSRLLHLLAGRPVAAQGQVSMRGSVNLVEQEIDPKHQTVADVLGVVKPLAALAKLEAGEGSAEDAAVADWTLETRISEALIAVGLPQMRSDRSVAGLSGGERMRLMMSRVHLTRPDLLLLDEPTNNMDQAGRQAVFELINAWRGGVLVASHDRNLLECMDCIIELTPQGVHITQGGWSDFMRDRNARLEQAEARLDRAETKATVVAAAARERADRQAKRDAKGRRSRSDGSQPKLVTNARKQQAEATASAGQRLAEKQKREVDLALKDARAQTTRLRPISFSLPACHLPSGRHVLAVDGLIIQHPGGPVIGPVSFSLTGPARVALTGPNGAGKSSVLRAIAMRALNYEEITLARPHPPMQDQHVSLLDAEMTILQNMSRLQPSLSNNAAYAALARFAFRNVDAHRNTAQLSGGERLRAALACIFAADPTPALLILDEPTNHLDLDSIQELEAALRSYDGALLVVSHDDAFLTQIGIETKIELPTHQTLQKILV